MEPPAEAAADPEQDDHLSRVKALTAKLKLQTRRPSFAEWQQKLESEPWKSSESWEPHSAPASDSNVSLTQGLYTNSDISLTSICGFANIGEALDWLRKELAHSQAPACGVEEEKLQRGSVRPFQTGERAQEVPTSRHSLTLCDTVLEQ
eukprot:g38865.t1